MTSRLAELREKSRKRKEYLKVTLGVDNLSEALGSDTVEPAVKRIAEVRDRKEGEDCEDKSEREDKEFRDSTAFLKGTQSLNPHNDYSQNFVDTGQRPQNFIRDTGESECERCEVCDCESFYSRVDRQIRGVSQVTRVDQTEGRSHLQDCPSSHVLEVRPGDLRYQAAGLQV